VGIEIKILRAKLNLSQAQLAERLETYQRRISRVERGEAQLRLDEMKKLREILLDGNSTAS
jgi:transcriptional regulator with XRE-family HTH domain